MKCRFVSVFFSAPFVTILFNINRWYSTGFDGMEVDIKENMRYSVSASK